MSDFVLILSLLFALRSLLFALRSTAGYLMFPLWFWVMGVKKTKTIASSLFYGKLNFSEKSKVLPLLAQFYTGVNIHLCKLTQG